MRVGIFVACLAVVTGLGHFGLIPAGIGTSNPLWLIALAILISSPISFIVLSRQREAMSEQVGGAVVRTRQRLHANRTMEDDVDDAARATVPAQSGAASTDAHAADADADAASDGSDTGASTGSTATDSTATDSAATGKRN
ncbi:DUF4229 domain-containing protein [Streptomyces lonarensis]|uniref:DUF4229 domain-containing protein n=2 Tax=Streptomyces lonarensis TaxID=700599 RepID=A0A7X6D2J8_9ACTN|nr:DUF4229 domain-containing protein [Streptomyces lonarensis]